MQIFKVAGHRRCWTPNFAANDKQLRLVVAQCVWNYFRMGGNVTRVPKLYVENVEALREIAKAGTAWFSRKTYKTHHMAMAAFRNKISAEKAGTYAELLMAVAYLSWRLGWNSPSIAERLFLTPCCVRQHLQRIRLVAVSLGLDAEIVPNKTRGRKLSKRGKRPDMRKRIRREHYIRLRDGSKRITFSRL